LPGKEARAKPYKYTRTFQSATTEIPVTEMNKDVLDEYIRGILGAKAQKKGPADAAAKQSLPTNPKN